MTPYILPDFLAGAVRWSILSGMSRLARLIVPASRITSRSGAIAAGRCSSSKGTMRCIATSWRCRKASVACRGYCLMPNHVHLILVPATADGLARAIGETHRQYTAFVNARQRWTGHLFQGVLLRRAGRGAPDARGTLRRSTPCVRVRCGDRRTGLASLRAHLDGRDDGLVTVAPLLDRLAGVQEL